LFGNETKTFILEELDMGYTLIDIDKLLESTLDLTPENNSNKLKAIEIDQLLDSTRDW
jgi:hypothetical protein